MTDASTRRVAVVVNPSKVAADDKAREQVEKTVHDLGWDAPTWLETSKEDPGKGMAEQAVRDGHDIVLAMGGDGTVMSCITALAGTGVPIGVLPAGTGNLLARNLDLPVSDVEEAVRVALTGTDRAIDVGVCGEHKFAIMAGLGFDAAMMRDAPEGLKSKVGWPAYIVSASRHLRGRRTSVHITLDDQPAMTRRIRTVVVGNVGKLQGGIPLMPDAVPDDGILDVVLIAPRNVLDWLRVAAVVLVRRRRPDFRVERFRAKSISIEAERPMPQQLDGEVIGDEATMVITMEPGALLVRVAEEGRRA